jgi:hypothetical protein
MISVTVKEQVKPQSGLKINVPAQGFSVMDIPGVSGAKIASSYVRISDLPQSLERYMEVNPRVPSRTKRGSLSGPIVKAIMQTLREQPEEMSVKNQGIYILADGIEYTKGARGNWVSMRLIDKQRNGIINGGHTFAAIREALETFEGEELARLQNAFVRVNIIQGLPRQMVADVAEGLNRSKQVDDLSLLNLQGDFDKIRLTLKNVQGASEIAYHQGALGSVYISEVLVYLEMFNQKRYNDLRHPNILYNKHSLGFKYFEQDMETDKHYMNRLVEKLPDLLWLRDSIIAATPEASKRNKFKFGLAKVDSGARAGSEGRKTHLPFLDIDIDYKVPNGWIYPMLAAFRANLKPDGSGWLIDPKVLLPEVIDQLVSVCISEHKENLMKPELTGKKEAAYSRCYDKVQNYLIKKGVA